MSGGGTRHDTDGHSITTVSTYINNKPVIFSSLTTPGDVHAKHISLLDVSDPNTPLDLLNGANMKTSSLPSGYYAKTCADYDGACLRDLVNSGCDAGPCAFLFWNTYAFGTCLAGTCYVGTQMCCTRWEDTWHEHG